MYRAPVGPLPATLPDHRSPRFLLVMRLPVGDTLFVTPTIHALRRRYPNALVTALVTEHTAPLLAHNADVDDVVVLPFGADWRGTGSLPGTLRCLVSRRYDVALNFSTPALGWVAPACGIRQQECLDFLPLWWLWPHDYAAWNRRHAVTLYATVARHLDIPPLERRLHVRVTPAEQAAIAARLHERHLQGASPRIVIHPGSGAAPVQKRWPLQRFAEVGRVLRQETGGQIIVAGGPSERELGNQLARAMGAGAVSLAGQLTLRQSLALFAASDLFVGNDSGPLHMAAAAGTPVVGIYGATDPAVFGPWAPPEQVAVVQPPGARPVIHFVGGATIWQQLARCRRPSPALVQLPAPPVIKAALRMLRPPRTAAGFQPSYTSGVPAGRATGSVAGGGG